MAQRLTHYLASPSKVASALDWKKMSGSILSLNISNGKIDMTLASHPEIGEPIKLRPIQLEFERNSNQKKRGLSPKVLAELQEIVQTNKVCSFVVGWPVQKEGRLGASCGRVLFTLDALIDSDKPIITKNRKVCLWDGSHVQLEHDDQFGRCSIYGLSSQCEKDFVHRASTEQYKQGEKNDVVVDVWNDFCRTHWPELADQAPQEECSFDYHSAEWLDEHYDEEGPYLRATAL